MNRDRDGATPWTARGLGRHDDRPQEELSRHETATSLRVGPDRRGTSRKRRARSGARKAQTPQPNAPAGRKARCSTWRCLNHTARDSVLPARAAPTDRGRLIRGSLDRTGILCSRREPSWSSGFLIRMIDESLPTIDAEVVARRSIRVVMACGAAPPAGGDDEGWRNGDGELVACARGVGRTGRGAMARRTVPRRHRSGWLMRSS